VAAGSAETHRRRVAPLQALGDRRRPRAASSSVCRSVATGLKSAPRGVSMGPSKPWAARSPSLHGGASPAGISSRPTTRWFRHRL